MDENVLMRVAPHNAEAEKGVIASMLLDNTAVQKASEILSPDDFYRKQYSLMFESMIELFNESKPLDPVTVQEKLRQKDIPSELSDTSAIKKIMMSKATSANIVHYAQIVKEKAVLRKLINVNEHIANLCYEGNESAEDILSETESKVFKLLETRNKNEFKSINQVAMDVLKSIEEAAQLKNPITGIPTGFRDLDYKIAGLQPSDLVLVAARPSMGKTAFVLNIINHVGVKNNLPCVIFSLEMSNEQLVKRILSMESLIDADKLRKGTLADEDWGNVVESIDKISRSNIIIDDTPGISITELRSKCRKFQAEKKHLSLIIIDYLQLMTGSRKGSESRQQEISEISRSLKALAREMNAPVVALSQLSRACETRPDHRPMLSDLRESGAIEQDADVVMFLYRDDYYNKDTEHPNEAEVIIAKQRNGPIGTVRLMWQPEVTRFVNMERSY